MEIDFTNLYFTDAVPADGVGQNTEVLKEKLLILNKIYKNLIPPEIMNRFEKYLDSVKKDLNNLDLDHNFVKDGKNEPNHLTKEDMVMFEQIKALDAESIRIKNPNIIL